MISLQFSIFRDQQGAVQGQDSQDSSSLKILIFPWTLKLKPGKSRRRMQQLDEPNAEVERDCIPFYRITVSFKFCHTKGTCQAFDISLIIEGVFDGALVASPACCGNIR